MLQKEDFLLYGLFSKASFLMAKSPSHWLL